jgi:hypothetical protein
MTDPSASPPQAPASSGPRPRLDYWHLWADAEGVSRFARCCLEDYELHRVGDAAPQWNLALADPTASVVFTVQPVGWVGEWHENPAPQWIVVLSGRWWIESMDGVRVEQGPGEISFGEDQGCAADAAGRRGHRSGTLGQEPAFLMTVRLQGPPGRRPCRFR